MERITGTLAVVTFASVVAFAMPAQAQSADNVTAEALFEAGRQLVEQGSLEEGCRKLEASETLDPAVGTKLHLADCWERTGRTASAWAMFREAASMAQATGQAPREQIARTRAAALEPKLSRVRINVPDRARVPGLKMKIGDMDIPAASLGMDVPVDPGHPIVRAEAPGFETWTQTLDVALDAPGNQSVEVPPLAPMAALAPTAMPTDAPPPSAARPVLGPIEGDAGRDDGEAQRIAGIVIGSVGLAGIATGAVLGAQAMVNNDDSLAECRPDDPTLCTSHGVDLRDTAADEALGSTIGFAAGGALVGIGLVVFLTAPDEDSAGPSLGRLRPTVSSSGASLSWGGSW